MIKYPFSSKESFLVRLRVVKNTRTLVSFLLKAKELYSSVSRNNQVYSKIILRELCHINIFIYDDFISISNRSFQVLILTLITMVFNV